MAGVWREADGLGQCSPATEAGVSVGVSAGDDSPTAGVGRWYDRDAIVRTSWLSIKFQLQ